MFKLSEVHLNKAKEFAVSNRIKKSCNVCYDRGYIGVTENNLLVPCHKCVDLEKVMSLWKDYVRNIPELREEFKELFEEDEKETETEAEDKES